jgi:chromatin structure-remodeling complex subunit RSC1/2
MPSAPTAVPTQQYQSQAPPALPVYQPPLQARAGNYTPQATHPSALQATPLAAHQYATPQHPSYPAYAANRLQAPTPAYNPNAPRPIEVFHLSDTANAAIPPEIREQFHRDDQGHVLFFSTPPLDLVPPARNRLGHSLKYLAAKAAKEEQRRAREQEKRQIEEEEAHAEQIAKRARLENDRAMAAKVESLTEKSVALLANQMVAGTNAFYQAVYGDRAEEIKAADRKEHARNILADRLSRKVTTQINSRSKDGLALNIADLKRSGVYLEDVN